VEEPIAMEPPVEAEEPIAMEPPAEVEEPIAVEPPLEVEEPIAMEPPLEVEEPIAMEPPVEVEEPIAMEPPAEAKTPVAIVSSVEVGELIANEGPVDLFEGPEQPVAELVTEIVSEEPVTEVVPEESLPALELSPQEAAQAGDFFEGLPDAELSFAESDELFASGDSAVITEGHPSLDGDLLVGSGESMEGVGDFFGDAGGASTSWLDEPITDTAEAPEWLKSPVEELPATEQLVSEVSLEAAIEEVAEQEALAPPPPAAVEAPAQTFTPPSFDGASVQERRRLVRLSCSYDTSAYLEGRPVKVKLVDISLGGGKLLGPASSFQRGQLIQVSNPLPEARVNEPVTARIVWIRPSREEEEQFDIGLQFEESPEVLGKSWVITVLNKIGMQSKVFNQRKYTRAAANLPIEIDLKTKDRYPGTALDIGLGGALVAVDRPLSPTTRFTLHMGPLGNHDKLELSCEVISSRHDQAGIGWTHSAKFAEISTTQTKLLGRYVVDLLKTGGSV